MDKEDFWTKEKIQEAFRDLKGIAGLDADLELRNILMNEGLDEQKIRNRHNQES